MSVCPPQRIVSSSRTCASLTKMFKFMIVSACTLAVASAGGYGRSPSKASASAASSYGGGSGSYSAGGSSYAGSGSAHSADVVQAAIQTKHNIEFREFPSTGNIQPTTIEVGASAIPLNILFRSASSSLNVLQQHEGSAGETQESESEDEPHRLIHSVRRPIIQEINEVVAPYRKITQQIQPVQEEINTIVARGQQQQQQQQTSRANAGRQIASVLVDDASVAGNLLGSLSSGGGDIKITSGKSLGKGLSKATSSGYASGAKAPSGTKGY